MEQQLAEKFSKALKDAMGMSTITYTELAKRLGVNKSTVSMYLHGKALPSLEIFDKISDILDVSADFLLGKREI